MRRLRAPRELRVEHLVGVVAERGRPVDALEEVGDPAPAVERRAAPGRQYGGTPPHCLGGTRGVGLEVALLPEPDLVTPRAPACAQRLEEGGLSCSSPLRASSSPYGRRVVRPLDLVERSGHLELGQVLARDEMAEVGGRETKVGSDGSHASSIRRGRERGSPGLPKRGGPRCEPSCPDDAPGGRRRSSAGSGAARGEVPMPPRFLSQGAAVC